MMNIVRGYYILFAILLAMPVAHAGQTGVMIKAGELKAEPFRDARTIGALAAGDKIEIFKKDGGWLQIKSAQGHGWVHMLSIRRGKARKTTAGGQVAGLAGLASGRAGTGRVIATTGIRGLNEEELKMAKYNETELKLAESYLTSKAEAQKFAAKGKLTVRKMDYLPDTGAGEAQ